MRAVVVNHTQAEDFLARCLTVPAHFKYHEIQPQREENINKQHKEEQAFSDIAVITTIRTREDKCKQHGGEHQPNATENEINKPSARTGKHRSRTQININGFWRFNFEQGIQP